MTEMINRLIGYVFGLITMYIIIRLTEREGEINRQDVLTYIDRVANSGMGKKKSLEYIRKYVEKADRKDEQTERSE